MEEKLELQVVVGTYDSMVRGLSFDLVRGGETGLTSSFSESGHTGSVRAVASCGRYLATGGTDEIIKLYDMRKLKALGALLKHEGTVNWLGFHQDKRLLSASEDGTVCVWECGSWQCTHTLTGHKGAVTGVAIHPSGNLALSVGKDRTLRTWNLVTGRSAFVQRLDKAAELVEWAPIGDHYALTSGTSVLHYDVKSGTNVSKMDVGKHINAMCFLENSVLAVGCELPDILVYSTMTGQCVAQWKGHTSRVKTLAVVPGANVVFSASSDGSVRAWKTTEKPEEAVCVSEVQLSSRLTCLALVYPEQLLMRKDSVTAPERRDKRGATSKGKKTATPSLPEAGLEEPRSEQQRMKKCVQGRYELSTEVGSGEKRQRLCRRKLMLNKIRRKRTQKC